MCSIIGAQWVTGKLPFFKIAGKTLHCRIYNAVGFCSIFCKFEVCTIPADFALCGFLEKSVFNSCSRKLKLKVL